MPVTYILDLDLARFKVLLAGKRVEKLGLEGSETLARRIKRFTGAFEPPSRHLPACLRVLGGFAHDDGEAGC